MIRTFRGAALLTVIALVSVPHGVAGHGSPSEWSAEASEYGCWITRWLARDAGGGGGEAVVGVQIVIGRIVPPRVGTAQPGVTQAELEGATTLNVRIVDPSLANAETVRVLRSGGDAVELEKRQLEKELGDFPSFYLTGAAAESMSSMLRDGQLAAIGVRQADGTEVRFSNTDDGLQVGLAMYDACLAVKSRQQAGARTAPAS